MYIGEIKMAANRCIYIVTVNIHMVLVVVAFAKLALQEHLRSQLFERYDGVLIGGGTSFSKMLWTLGLRLLQLVDIYAILLHGFSIILSNRLFKEPYSRHLNGMSHLWSILTVCYLLSNLLTVMLFIRFIDITYSSLQDSLYAGLEMFQFDAKWSDFWNNLQTHDHCCGVRKHIDWNGMLWQNTDQEDQFRRLLSDHTVLVPISCCRKGIQQLHYCVGERVNLGVTELRSINLTTTNIINHPGCFDAIRIALSYTVHAITTLDVVICSMQVCSLFAMRILFISNRNYQSHSPML